MTTLNVEERIANQGERITRLEVLADQIEKRLDRLDTRMDWVLGLLVAVIIGIGGILIKIFSQ